MTTGKKKQIKKYINLDYAKEIIKIINELVLTLPYPVEKKEENLILTIDIFLHQLN